MGEKANNTQTNYYADTIPRYQRIALEIASRIASGEYEEGQKVSGRSSIAGQYGVSPETARRAFSVLSDNGIVDPWKGSGMFIKSRKNAEKYDRIRESGSYRFRTQDIR